MDIWWQEQYLYHKMSRPPANINVR